MWKVYLLRSLNYNYSYVGITKDLEKRLKEHNGILKGGAKATAARRPFEILYYIDNIPERSTASKLEYSIKNQYGIIQKSNYMQQIKNQLKNKENREKREIKNI